MKFNPANIWALALVPVVVLADQVSKWLVLSEPRFNAMGCLTQPNTCGTIPLPGPIDFSMLWNRGMSYGFLQSEGFMRWVLAALMLVIALGFMVWLLRAEGRLLKLSLALVVGGAFGNLIDRVRFGAVVDFINAGALHFPWVFNVADAAISVGAVLLFVDQFLLSGRKQAKA
ncbi:signal peptidase II [Hyphomonas johnsonii]|uniref:Lipoprotein signal peptidase n=1 Tax=Hyphomonas johnsonii MHS-2 TaxID=1280950 RepID=A0A059FFL9_9PROT|nr:signal peptidase II [Hyphomonas johnsonii]KCZ89414.1 signal peptidase II [Hyphomonas johnsonii MHS-2]